MRVGPSSLVLDRQEELELRRKLFLRVKSIREVDPSNSAVSMNLYSQGFNVVGTISPSCEIRQVKLNLVPAFIKAHRHGTNKRLDSCCGLVV